MADTKANTASQPELSDGAWGSVAAEYDGFSTPLSARFLTHAKERIDLPPAPGHVLDVACGTGAATEPLLEMGYQVTGLDYDKGMLDIYAKKYPQAGAVHGSATDLSMFKDDSFDIVVCLFGVMFLPDRQGFLREAKRVLKAGGLFVATTWPPAETSEFMTDMYGALSKAIGIVTGNIQEGDPDPKVSNSMMDDGEEGGEESGLPWSSVEEAQGEIRSAGFNDLDSWIQDNEVPFTDPIETTKGALVSALFLKDQTSKMTEAEVDATVTKAVDLLGTQRKGFSMPCLMHKATNN